MVSKATWPPVNGGVQRISVSLDPIDVDLIDRLSALEGLNRSAELRALLLQLRPVLQATVTAFETAARQRQMLDEAAMSARVSSLELIQPEVEDLNRRVMGIIAGLEGAEAAADENPRPSNTGVTPPPPTNSTDEN